MKRRWMRVTGVAPKYFGAVTSRQSLESWHERGNILAQRNKSGTFALDYKPLHGRSLSRSFACIRRHPGTNRDFLRGKDMGVFQVALGLGRDAYPIDGIVMRELSIVSHRWVLQ
jgi:hypothetical protein